MSERALTLIESMGISANGSGSHGLRSRSAAAAAAHGHSGSGSAASAAVAAAVAAAEADGYASESVVVLNQLVLGVRVQQEWGQISEEALTSSVGVGTILDANEEDEAAAVLAEVAVDRNNSLNSLLLSLTNGNYDTTANRNDGHHSVSVAAVAAVAGEFADSAVGSHAAPLTSLFTLLPPQIPSARSLTSSKENPRAEAAAATASANNPEFSYNAYNNDLNYINTDFTAPFDDLNANMIANTNIGIEFADTATEDSSRGDHSDDDSDSDNDVANDFEQHEYPWCLDPTSPPSEVLTSSLSTALQTLTQSSLWHLPAHTPASAVAALTLLRAINSGASASDLLAPALQTQPQAQALPPASLRQHRLLLLHTHALRLVASAASCLAPLSASALPPALLARVLPLALPRLASPHPAPRAAAAAALARLALRSGAPQGRTDLLVAHNADYLVAHVAGQVRKLGRRGLTSASIEQQQQQQQQQDDFDGAVQLALVKVRAAYLNAMRAYAQSQAASSQQQQSQSASSPSTADTSTGTSVVATNSGAGAFVSLARALTDWRAASAAAATAVAAAATAATAAAALPRLLRAALDLAAAGPELVPALKDLLGEVLESMSTAAAVAAAAATASSSPNASVNVSASEGVLVYLDLVSAIVRAVYRRVLTVSKSSNLNSARSGNNSSKHSNGADAGNPLHESKWVVCIPYVSASAAATADANAATATAATSATAVPCLSTGGSGASAATYTGLSAAVVVAVDEVERAHAAPGEANPRVLSLQPKALTLQGGKITHINAIEHAQQQQQLQLSAAAAKTGTTVASDGGESRVSGFTDAGSSAASPLWPWHEDAPLNGRNAASSGTVCATAGAVSEQPALLLALPALPPAAAAAAALAASAATHSRAAATARAKSALLSSAQRGGASAADIAQKWWALLAESKQIRGTQGKRKTQSKSKSSALDGDDEEGEVDPMDGVKMGGLGAAKHALSKAKTQRKSRSTAKDADLDGSLEGIIAADKAAARKRKIRQLRKQGLDAAAAEEAAATADAAADADADGVANDGDDDEDPGASLEEAVLVRVLSHVQPFLAWPVPAVVVAALATARLVVTALAAAGRAAPALRAYASTDSSGGSGGLGGGVVMTEEERKAAGAKKSKNAFSTMEYGDEEWVVSANDAASTKDYTADVGAGADDEKNMGGKTSAKDLSTSSAYVEEVTDSDDNNAHHSESGDGSESDESDSDDDYDDDGASQTHDVSTPLPSRWDRRLLPLLASLWPSLLLPLTHRPVTPATAAALPALSCALEAAPRFLAGRFAAEALPLLLAVLAEARARFTDTYIGTSTAGHQTYSSTSASSVTLAAKLIAGVVVAFTQAALLPELLSLPIANTHTDSSHSSTAYIASASASGAGVGATAATVIAAAVTPLLSPFHYPQALRDRVGQLLLLLARAEPVAVPALVAAVRTRLDFAMRLNFESESKQQHDKSGNVAIAGGNASAGTSDSTYAALSMSSDKHERRGTDIVDPIIPPLGKELARALTHAHKGADASNNSNTTTGPSARKAASVNAGDSVVPTPPVALTAAALAAAESVSWSGLCAPSADGLATPLAARAFARAADTVAANAAAARARYRKARQNSSANTDTRSSHNKDDDDVVGVGGESERLHAMMQRIQPVPLPKI